MSQQRHSFKKKNADETWIPLPDKSGIYKEEHCENCHCIRMSIRYDKDPYEIYYKFKREEGHEYKATVVKCSDGYRRNRDRSASEHGKPIFIPKSIPKPAVNFKENLIEDKIEIDYERAETIADLLGPKVVDEVTVPDIGISFEDLVSDLIKKADEPKRRAEQAQKYAHTGAGIYDKATAAIKPEHHLYKSSDFVSEEQARLDEALILIKLLKDNIEERGLNGFSTELRIAERILKLNKISV